MYDYEVQKSETLSRSSHLLTLAPAPGKPAMSFEPGQYTAISLRRSHRPTTTRCFSLIGVPHSPALLQLGIRVGGDFTLTSARMMPGDYVALRGPFGNFTLGQARTSKFVFLAAGIGITPFISMLRSLAVANHPVTLLYANSSDRDVPFAAELDHLEREHPGIRVHIVFSRPGRGRLSVASLSSWIKNQPGSRDYYVCGPNGFKQTALAALRGASIEPRLVHVEDFGLSGGLVSSLTSPIARRVFATTTLGFLAATLAVTYMDLKTTAARMAAVQLPAPTSAPASSASSSSGTSEQAAPDATAPTATAAPTTTTVTQEPASSASQNQSTYQSPMTSVS